MIDPVCTTNEDLPDARQRRTSRDTDLRRIDRDFAPAQKRLPFGQDRFVNDGSLPLGLACVLRKEDQDPALKLDYKGAFELD